MRSTLLFALCLFVTACATDGPKPATVTTDRFRQLGWIVGEWHGAWAGGAPFFESYRMMDDSTLVSTTWADTSFSLATDSSTIRLRNGVVSSGTDAVATEWSATSVHFEPNGKATNSYTWHTEGPDRWTARLFWTDKSGAPQERVYTMTRIGGE